MKSITVVLALLVALTSRVAGKHNAFISDEGKTLDMFRWIERKGKGMEGKPWPKEFTFPLNYIAEFNVYYNTEET